MSSEGIHCLQICAGKLHFVENPGGVVQQMPAGSRQLCPSAMSVEEAAIQLILQRFYGMTHCRLGEENLTGGLREAAATRKGHEREQLAAVEDWLPEATLVFHCTIS
jgi:hypothetical protein